MAKQYAELIKVPAFLEAIGMKPDAVAITCYGGNGGNWHFKKDSDGHCIPVQLNNQVLNEVNDLSNRACERVGHQLGFYPQFGGSTKAQSQGSPCLKVESDAVSKDEQLRAYRAFEHTYDVKLTLVDTGGKSIHAYLAIDETIQPNDYHRICKCFHQRLVDNALHQEIDFVPDSNVARITQAMRLPGAIHKKTGNIATVLQLGRVCSLDQIECGPDDINAYQRESATCHAIADICTDGQVLGYEGDEALQILASIALVWEKRIPGGETYDKVLPLVGGLTSAVGAETAAQILFDAGHNDKGGRHNLKGLLAWCRSFSNSNTSPAEATARLITTAQRVYGWTKPQASTSIVRSLADVHVQSKDELRSAIASGSALIDCKTGLGKSETVLGLAVELHDEARRNNGANSRFAACILSPRVVINEQNQRLTGGRDVSTGKGLKPNFYLCCLQSFGKQSKLWGSPELWVSYGDRSTGGMPAAAVLVLDEIRQVFESIFLGSVGNGEVKGFWKTPEDRFHTFQHLIWSIRGSVYFYGMDAQLGAPELQLIEQVKNQKITVIGNPAKTEDRLFRWTNQINTFKNVLLNAVDDPNRTKPVILITGAKGEEEDNATGGISAWALKRWLKSQTIRTETGCSPLRIKVIDRNTKEDAESQQILAGDPTGFDLVICTPVVQSGFSFIGKFHEIGFVAGGVTMAPNVIAQAARRERTLKLCYGYFPTTAVDTSLPFFTANQDENRRVVHEAMQHHGAAIGGTDEQLMIDTALIYIERRVKELALFTEYTLAYLTQDGWQLEAMPDAVIAHKKPPKAAAKGPKEVIQWDDLSNAQKVILQALSGDLTINQIKVIQANAVKGATGLDLVGQDLPGLIQLLIDSGLVALCDGEQRQKDDPAVIQCGMKLQEPRAVDLINRCAWLGKVRIGRSKKDPKANCVKTIGAIVRSLGGQPKPCGNGRRLIVWELPGECT